MPKPCSTLTHLKTSKQYDGKHLINRHWFEWSDRKSLSLVVLRVELLDESGAVLTTGSFQLKKTKIISQVAGTPAYDTSVWLQLDDIDREVRPASFRYWTVEGLMLKKSEIEAGEMNDKFENLERFG